MDLLSQYKGLRRENYVLAFGRLVTGLGSMAWPMMTLILSQKMGIDAQRISWLLSAAMIIMMPAVFLGGRIADRFDKKMTIVTLDLFSVVCFLICACIPLSWLTIILMFFGSVGQNMENPAYNALTADITVTDDRDRSYSLQYLCANLGLVMSPTIAGILFKNYLWLVFLINGVSIFCSASMIFLMVRDVTPERETGASFEYQKERIGESVWRVLADNRTVMLFMAVVSGYYAVYQMYVYLMPLDMAAMHGDSGALIYGSVTSVNCVVVVVFTPIITKLFGSRSEPSRVSAGVVLLVAGFAIFTVFEGHIPVYYIAMTILTWGEVFAMTAESAYISRRIPASHRGRINGILHVVRTALTSVFQLTIGAVYETHGSRTSWIVTIATGCVFIAVSLAVIARDRRDYPGLY